MDSKYVTMAKDIVAVNKNRGSFQMDGTCKKQPKPIFDKNVEHANIINSDTPSVIRRATVHVIPIGESLEGDNSQRSPKFPKPQNLSVDINIDPEIQPLAIRKSSVARIRLEPGEMPEITNLSKSVSTVSNIIKDYLVINDVFDLVNGEITEDNLSRKDFYIKIQNCIFHTLVDYVGITRSNNGYVLPEITTDTEYLPTLHFFDRMFNETAVSAITNPLKVMNEYRSIFADCDGIQSSWIDKLILRMMDKAPLTPEGIQVLLDIIEPEWTPENNNENSDVINTPVSPVRVIKHPNLEDANSIEYTSLFEDDEDDEDDYGYEYDDDDDNETGFIKVGIIEDSLEKHIVLVTAGGRDINTVYPFYCELHKVPDDYVPSLADDRNGIWDGLIHFSPNIMFTTKNPGKYMECNAEAPGDVKVVILDKIGDLYYCGIYNWQGIHYMDDDGNTIPYDHDDYTIIGQVMYLIKTNVGNGEMSHLNRTLSRLDLFSSEEEINNELLSYLEDDDEDEDNEDEGDDTEDDEDDEGEEDIDSDEDNDDEEVVAMTIDTSIDVNSIKQSADEVIEDPSSIAEDVFDTLYSDEDITEDDSIDPILEAGTDKSSNPEEDEIVEGCTEFIDDDLEESTQDTEYVEKEEDVVEKSEVEDLVTDEDDSDFTFSVIRKK